MAHSSDLDAPDPGKRSDELTNALIAAHKIHKKMAQLRSKWGIIPEVKVC